MIRGEDSPLVVSGSPKWGDGGKGQVDPVKIIGRGEVEAGGTSGFGKRSPHGMTMDGDYKKLVGVRMLGTLMTKRQDEGVRAEGKLPRNLMLLRARYWRRR